MDSINKSFNNIIIFFNKEMKMQYRLINLSIINFIVHCVVFLSTHMIGNYLNFLQCHFVNKSKTAVIHSRLDALCM